ncbi:hypothetical protein QEJ31_04555 [Pigmentibacter sp. JX0631]|uniref:hypothetical protein n=1 Tax=Pigmentibacter sp. JX0631 TaxID=2976982 RepID=UPI00246882CE|nr:hypothetical protein [Pigmentibacter sp. JX0631]WGL60867.1 hypothetical protein QEJ31_04555 [Pigmentibacter sp. JX0631]
MKKILLTSLSLCIFQFKAFAEYKTRVIIGNGTSAQVFRRTASIDNWKTIVIGGNGLWDNFKEHKMGQTAHILHLPGQIIPAFINADGKNNLTGFLDSSTYQFELNKLSQQNNYRDNAIVYSEYLVKNISRNGKKVIVNASSKNMDHISIQADEVILTTGIPPQRNLSNLIQDAHKKSNNLGFVQIQEAVEYLSKESKYYTTEPLTVALYGGSATAAWVADVIDERQPLKFYWFARPGKPGEDKFKEAAVAGDRNYLILKKTEAIRQIKDVESIIYMSEGDLDDKGNKLSKPKVKINFNENFGKESIFVDQLIYALGGDPNSKEGIKNILSENLNNELIPIRDNQYVIVDYNSPKKETYGLGWTTSDGMVKIIGTAAYNFSSRNGIHSVQPPMETLPTNGQVPHGIAVAASTISALNNYIPIIQDRNGKIHYSMVNINTANSNQLASFIAIYYQDLKEKFANLAVEKIIAARSNASKAFGISDTEFNEIINYIRFLQKETLDVK